MGRADGEPVLCDEKKSPASDDASDAVVITLDGEVVNASGHRDQLQRQYGILAICGLALTVDNAWVVLGLSLSISIGTGGPPGVLYELLVACFYYGFIATSLAELSSAIPTAGGVYHWASVTPGPKYGRVVGFFAGSINFFGWLFDLAAITYIQSQVCVQLYYIYHPDLEIQPWHYYIAFVLVTILVASFNIFFNRLIPYTQYFGCFMVVVGGLVTIIVVAAMPAQHASNSFVWTEFANGTGWPDGVAFLIGVLNGAFTIGTPEATTHLAEDVPSPSKYLPLSLLAQMGLGTITAFCFAIAVLYGITSLDDILSYPGAFPLTALYQQATGSTSATFSLLFIIFLSLMPCLCGTYLTVGRIWWALARDNVTPFAKTFAHVNERLSCPIEATMFVSVLTIALGAITLGSKTAFTDLTGSFIILSSTSYGIAIVANLTTGRKNMPRGWFNMGPAGFAINAVTVLLIVFFNIMFMFPPALPTTESGMNYNSVILAGVVVLTTIWWFSHGLRNYPGPRISKLYGHVYGVPGKDVPQT